LYYKPFEALYGTTITKKYRSSHQKQTPIVRSNQKKERKKREVKYSIPFCLSLIYARNIGVTVICNTILYTYRTIFNKTCKLSTTTLTRQCYEVSESFDEYSDSNDKKSSLASPSQFYQKHEGNKNNNNAQTDNFYSKEHKQNKEDEINNPI
ncbi:3617_t:CDS:2, partial [Gigaspora margarita]